MSKNAFESETFEAYREKQREIQRAIKLLKENNYEVILLKSTRR